MVSYQLFDVNLKNFHYFLSNHKTYLKPLPEYYYFLTHPLPQLPPQDYYFLYYFFVPKMIFFYI